MLKQNLLPFHFSTITLHLLRESDLADTLAWRNSAKKWFNNTSEIQFINHIDWYKQYQTKDNDFVFIIEDKHFQKIGQIAVYNIQWEDKSAEMGRLIVNPAFAGKGLMKMACLALLSLCKNNLNLDSLTLEVKKHNLRAVKLYEKCGFVKSNIDHPLLHFYQMDL